jgi:hypothetical protein
MAWHSEHSLVCACRPIPAKLLAQMSVSGAAPATAAVRSGVATSRQAATEKAASSTSASNNAMSSKATSSTSASKRVTRSKARPAAKR